MRLLAVETSTARCSVALWERGLIASVDERGERLHAARLVPMIETVLAEAGWPASSLDSLAAGIGPGSFTGLRIGLATIKAMGFALERPVVGVPSLEAISLQAVRASGHPWPELAAAERLERVAAVGAAKRGELYVSFRGQAWAASVDESLVRLERMAEAEGPPATIAGYGLEEDVAGVPLFERLLSIAPDAAVAPRETWHPGAAAVAELAEARQGIDPLLLVPMYLRRSSAEELWEARRMETERR